MKGTPSIGRPSPGPEPTWPAERYAEAGFAIVEKVLAPETLVAVRAETDRLLAAATERGGCRNALKKSVPLRDLAEAGTLLDCAREALGLAARPVKLTIFDKTPRANWKVPWHQDLTITVGERREVAGFGPWSTKGGLPHVQPTAEVLEAVLAVRVHLDDTPATNGALRVLPGSHLFGKLPDEHLSRLLDELEEVVCELRAGDAMLMSPLLVHASSSAEAASRRRVLHYEFARESLPGGLQWA